MPNICMYFQVHQPYRLKKYRLFDIGIESDYFDNKANVAILNKVSDKCYGPANQCLLDLIEQTRGQFQCAFSLSGVFVEQIAQHRPDVLASFQQLVDSRSVELLGETYHHSLASLVDEAEFADQVLMHRHMIQETFDCSPKVFRNTELIFKDALAPTIRSLGFQAALVEGVERSLRWRSPNYVYAAHGDPKLKLLARNYPLSDDVGFRFSNRGWREWPLTAEKYVRWIADSPGDTVNLFLDYETFGEHQWADTGIFEFLRHFVHLALDRGMKFVTPSLLATHPPQDTLSFLKPTSWADIERDVSAWLGNRLQQAAHQRFYGISQEVKRSENPALINTWRRLSTSDHYYYMCTKWFADGDVHKYFNPYESPYDAFIAFMNAMEDFEQRLHAKRSPTEAVLSL